MYKVEENTKVKQNSKYVKLSTKYIDNTGNIDQNKQMLQKFKNSKQTKIEIRQKVRIEPFWKTQVLLS